MELPQQLTSHKIYQVDDKHRALLDDSNKMLAYGIQTKSMKGDNVHWTWIKKLANKSCDGCGKIVGTKTKECTDCGYRFLI